LREEAREGQEVVFGLVLHPDTSGMAHVVGMVKRFLEWLKGFGEEVEWCRYEEVAEQFAHRSRGGAAE
jgi:hypothetical protein